MRLAVVGGGIAGLAAAYYKAERPAERAGAELESPLRGHAGLDGVVFHHLRHVYASMMIEGAISISATVLADQMGHRSPTVIYNTYVHLFNRQGTKELVHAALQEAMENRQIVSLERNRK